jgi:hypothetical protein
MNAKSDLDVPSAEVDSGLKSYRVKIYIVTGMVEIFVKESKSEKDARTYACRQLSRFPVYPSDVGRLVLSEEATIGEKG